MDFKDELVPLSGSPSSSLATPEDERDWIPTQGPDRVSSGSNDEVVALDNGFLESGAASPADAIALDDTHSASVIHHKDVGSDREKLIPTFANPPRTLSIDFHSHHQKYSLKARLRTSQFSLRLNSTVSLAHTGFTSFQPFHTPASSISDDYEPYHSTQSSPLSHSRLPREHQSRSPPLPHDMPIICTHCQSHTVCCADPRYLLPRSKQAQGNRRYLHTLPAES